jgi:hypothetical protein
VAVGSFKRPVSSPSALRKFVKAYVFILIWF